MLAVYQQRIVEARNAAYMNELYLHGETGVTDKGLEITDNINQHIEKRAQLAALLGTGFNNLRGLNYSELTGKLVTRYATKPDDPTFFYKSMLTTTRDNMNSYHVEDGDPNLMTPKIKNFYKTLDQHPSGITTGVSYSKYFSAAGIFLSLIHISEPTRPY